ncbi:MULTISPECIES: sensor histidine kinase [Bacillus]|uniref:sensor histidine kinase n=1 Tax=Bacillus TaxID=1386 RepID=UPI0002E9C6E1|nr:MULTISPECIES: HAMP domain-containing sensor histidine kinase [Bacillus]
MKIWQKVYIFSVLIFFIIFNTTNIFIIEKKYRTMLNNDIQLALAEQFSFYSGLNVSIPLYTQMQLYSTNIYSMENLISNSIKNYIESNSKNEAIVEVMDKEGAILYSNAPFKIPTNRKEIEDLKENTRHYIIRDIDDKTYIFISNLITIEKEDYILTYIRDISPVFKDRKNDYSLFLKIDFAATILFVVMMFFVSSYITRPIHHLIDATKRISKGHFSEKVRVQTKDEFAILAKHFNTMSDMIEEKINELKKNNEEKQRFINNLTHELKTPLTSIIGYSDLLRKTKYDEKIFNEGLHYIYKEGKRLEDLASHLMRLLDKDENVLLKNESILDVILDIKGAITPYLNEKNMNLLIEGKDFKVDMERELIKIVISNLVTNSIKASPEGTTIEIHVNNKDFKIEVKDYGCGIPREHIKNVFEPFFMVNKSRTRNNNGAGLGLAICKRIMDIHHGSIMIESEVGKGTVVTLLFDSK